MSKTTTAQQTKSNKENHHSVTRLLIILICAVFVIEAFVMNIMHWMPPTTKTISALLDAAILSLLLFPIFYYLVFRPLIRNIEERKLIEDDLRIAAVAFEIKDPTLITDVSGNIIRANKKFLAKLGYSMEEIVGQNPRIFKSGMHDQKFYEQLWKELLRTGCWSGEVRSKTKEGRILHPFWLTITAIKNEQQETTHYIGIYNF